MKIKSFIKDKYIYVVAFCVPWLLIFFHSFIRGGWPFHESVILRGDSGLQYYQLCVELWNKIHNGGSLLYSWHAGGGFDFFLNFAYYLVSPFTLLIILAPKTYLSDMVQIVMILKWSCVYVSFVYYFMHTKHNKITNKRKLISFVLGSLVALSNTMLIYITYFNWNDVLVLFPFLLLQVEKILEGEYSKKYYLLLSVTILCNFYMAYQVCIFLAIWFFSEITIERKNINDIRKKIMFFIVNSVLSAISGMIIILPAVICGFNRNTNFSGDSKANYISHIVVNVFEFFNKFFVFDDISDSMSYNPNIYFSIGALVFLMLYAGVKSKYKIRNISIILFLICGIFIGGLGYVMHGFSIPHGIYHRFIYMLIFMTGIVILDIIENIESIKRKNIVISMIILDFLLILSYFMIDSHLEAYVYLTTLVLLIIYEITVMVYFKKTISLKSILCIFCFFTLGELFLNAEYELKNYYIEPLEKSYNTYNVEKLIQNVDVNAGERINVIGGLRNDGLLYKFDSNDMFLSYTNVNVINLVMALGMDYFSDAGYGLVGSSPVSNIIFNQKYGISDSDKVFSDVQKENTIGDISLYKTERLAGLGYMVQDKITDWNTNRIEPFAIQNEFINLATGEGDIFNVEKPNVICSNIDGVIDPVPQYKEAGFYLYQYSYNNREDSDCTLVEFEVPRDMDLYVVSNNFKKAALNVYLDDINIYNDSVSHSQQTIHIGDVKSKQIVKIYAYHDIALGESNMMWYQFGSFNENNFEEAYKKLSANVYNIDEFKDTYISGNIHSDENGIMMTSIQAVDGFSVYVDGKKVKYNTIAGSFIGVPLDKGDHSVEFIYVTPYLKEGMVCSIVGVILYVFYIFFLTKQNTSGTLYKDVSTHTD